MFGRREGLQVAEAHAKLLMYTLEIASRLADEAGEQVHCCHRQLMPWGANQRPVITHPVPAAAPLVPLVWALLKSRCLTRLPQCAGSGKMTWLVDLTGCSLYRLPMATLRENMNLLRGHYPERLARLIVFQPPLLFAAAFGVRLQPGLLQCMHPPESA